MNSYKNKFSIAIIILALGFLLVPIISYIRYLAMDYNYPPVSAEVRMPAVLIFTLLSYAYWIFLNSERLNFETKPKKSVVFAVFALGVFLCSIYPLFSIDLYEYIIRGRIFTVYHANPYIYTPIQFTQDLFYNIPTAKIFWEKSTMIYGPVWTYIVSAVTMIAGNSIFVNLFLLKLVLFMLHVLCAFSIYKIAVELKIESPVKAAYAYLLNPFILIVTAVDGHMDTSMICFLLLSLYLLYKGRIYLSFFTLSISIMTKYFSVFIAPFYIIYLYAHIQDKRVLFKKLFISFVVSAVTILIAYLPFCKGFRVFSEFKTMLTGIDSTTFTYWYNKLLCFLLPGISLEVFRYLCYAFFALIYFSLLVFFVFSKNKAQKLPLMILLVFSAYIIFAAFQLNPWYLLMIIPFILISDIPK
ncbi:MAG: polyprenol phosphomannose-dependent alpha 1,6 mannosyltransferase MptB, partial [Candidatus Omnitrophica bacterium]|nr:polyprenol phosphomannose-dependent alpha 1,6 mannosyltransferase MptB [Candidatus Omnitrophota bacterium]